MPQIDPWIPPITSGYNLEGAMMQPQGEVTMSSILGQSSEIALKLRLSLQAQAKLAEQAASSGRDISDIASDLIEKAITRPSIAEIMAPVRKQVAESGMSEQELDDFLRGEIEANRREKREKKAKSA